jgi:heme-degrading monooxygenase HmoA
MFSRVTLLEVDTVRTDPEAALHRYRDEVLPRLREQPGYEGTFVLLNPEGQGLILSLWRDEAALESTTFIATEALQRFATIFRAPPGRERYEVRIADLPAHSLG